MDRCTQCGFVYDDLPADQVAAAIRGFGAAYRAELAGVDEELARARPAPEVWSVLEYACHVRDVLLVQRDRALLALLEARPRFARMYRDERVALAGYHIHPPARVADQLDMKKTGVTPVVIAPIAVPQPDGAVKLGAGAAELNSEEVAKATEDAATR